MHLTRSTAPVGPELVGDVAIDLAASDIFATWSDDRVQLAHSAALRIDERESLFDIRDRFAVEPFPHGSDRGLDVLCASARNTPVRIVKSDQVFGAAAHANWRAQRRPHIARIHPEGQTGCC